MSRATEYLASKGLLNESTFKMSVPKEQAEEFKKQINASSLTKKQKQYKQCKSKNPDYVCFEFVRQNNNHQEDLLNATDDNIEMEMDDDVPDNKPKNNKPKNNENKISDIKTASVDDIYSYLLAIGLRDGIRSMGSSIAAMKRGAKDDRAIIRKINDAKEKTHMDPKYDNMKD